MHTLYTLLALLGAGLIIWFSYRAIRQNPTTFQRESMQKSFYTMGILALLLIAFVAFLVLIVRQ